MGFVVRIGHINYISLLNGFRESDKHIKEGVYGGIKKEMKNQGGDALSLVMSSF